MIVQWNKEVFGGVGTNIIALGDQLQFLKEELQKGHNLEVEEDYLLIIKGELECWENCEETRLSQMAKKKWLTKGEKNTKFFHATINQSRNVTQIHLMCLKDGNLLATLEKIHEGTVNYFQAFLTKQNVETTLDLEQIIFEAITREDNAAICQLD